MLIMTTTAPSSHPPEKHWYQEGYWIFTHPRWFEADITSYIFDEDVPDDHTCGAYLFISTDALTNGDLVPSYAAEQALGLGYPYIRSGAEQ